MSVLLLALSLAIPGPSPRPQGLVALPPEGETVASVRIEAPAEVLPRLLRHVEMKAGEPFRAEAVRHAVELLHATGEFEDVLVEAERLPSGLGIVFRPRPAPLLLAIRVEGDPVLTPRALRRITRLREGEPLWPARMEQAGRDAALALVGEGYLEARVTATASRHEGGADAVFGIRSGPRVRVAQAEVEADTAAAELLRGLVEPRPGEVFRRERAQKAAEKMRRRLAASGRWRAAVEVRESYDPATARLALAFHVAPGPVTSVAFPGASPPRALRGVVEDLLREGALKSDVLEEAADRIEEAFRRRGHRGVAVSHHEEARPGGVTMVFEVQAGPLATVASVRVAGDGPAGLETLLSTKHGEPLQDRRVEEDVAALQGALEDRGHAEALVEAEVPEGGGQLPVVFQVRAGPRIRVGSVSVEAPSPLPREAEPREMRLRTGAPYRVRDLARDRDSLLSAYRNAGHLQAEVTPAVTFSEDRKEARVRLLVSPGPRTFVDHIVIAGRGRTREEVVRRELRIEEGRPLGLKGVIESQQRLGALGIFERVSVAEMDPESVPARSVVVSVREAPLTTVTYGIGYGERELLRASVEVGRRNLFGLDRSLSGFTRFSFRGSRFLVTFREPYLLGSRQELFVTAFREEEDRPRFDFVRFGGLLQTGRSLSPAWSLILRYTIQQTETFNTELPCIEIDRQFCPSTVSGPSVSIVNDTRDDPLDPRRGRFVGADVQLSHRVLGGDSLLKGFFQAATYQRLSARALLALSGRMGLARTLGIGEPLLLKRPERFYAGGDYSLRGFAVDGVNPEGGNGLLLGGVELRVDAGRYLSAAAFSDAGNIYSLAGDLSLKDLRYTAGLGLRYKSALGPLRFDWGYKLNRRAGEKPYHLHFTVGHAF